MRDVELALAGFSAKARIQHHDNLLYILFDCCPIASYRACCMAYGLTSQLLWSLYVFRVYLWLL